MFSLEKKKEQCSHLNFTISITAKMQTTPFGLTLMPKPILIKYYKIGTV